MKKITTLSLAVLAAALTSSAFADEVKFCVKADQHGNYRFQYRATEPTLAVYVGGQSYGQSMGDSRGELVLKFRDDGHGQRIPLFVADDRIMRR